MEFFRIFFITFTLIQYSVWCRSFEECEGISVRDVVVVVASKKSCAKYVFCDGENSYEAECLGDFYFNANIGSCDDPINVNCNIEQSDNVQSIFDENSTSIKSEKQTTKSDESIDINVNWNENGMTQVGLDSNKKNSSLTESHTPTPIPICPPLKGVNNTTNIANSESCVAFYTCYNGRAISMLCPSGMYFNEQSGKCQSQMPESCKAKFSVRLDCVKGVYEFVPHPSRCEYYFYCANGYLMIMRCPNNYAWHYERGTCVHNSNAKCFSEQPSFYRGNTN